MRQVLRPAAGFSIAAVLVAAGCVDVAEPVPTGGIDPVTITGENFRELVLENPQPVLIDCYADWCGPCKQQEPHVRSVAEEFQGRALVGKLNVDDEPELASQFGVEGIPTLLFFHQGELVEHEVGLTSRSTLVRKLDGLVAKAGPPSSAGEAEPMEAGAVGE